MEFALFLALEEEVIGLNDGAVLVHKSRTLIRYVRVTIEDVFAHDGPWATSLSIHALKLSPEKQ